MGKFHDVHMEQLKPFLEDEVLHEPLIISPHEETQEKRPVGEVIGHRKNPQGQDEFLVRMEKQAPSEASWLKVKTMIEEGIEIPTWEKCTEKGWKASMYEHEEE